MSETRPLPAICPWCEHVIDNCRVVPCAEHAALAREQQPPTDDFETFKRGWRQALSEVKAAGEDSNGIADLKLRLDDREHQLKAALARLAAPALPASVEEALDKLTLAVNAYHQVDTANLLTEYAQKSAVWQQMVAARDALITAVEQPLLAEIERQRLEIVALSANLQAMIAQAEKSDAAQVAAEADLASLKAEQAWRPIETAPKGSGKDGPQDTRHPDYIEPPKLWLALDDGQRCVGYWDWYYAEGGAGHDGGSAWVEVFSGERVQALHWKPLPPPPLISGTYPPPQGTYPDA